MIAIVIAIGGVWFDNEKLKENRAQATVNLLRFFVDDIAGSYPKDHPSYKGVTTRDFALVRVLYDAEEIARKIEGSEIESFLEHSPN